MTFDLSQQPSLGGRGLGSESQFPVPPVMGILNPESGRGFTTYQADWVWSQAESGRGFQGKEGDVEHHYNNHIVSVGHLVCYCPLILWSSR